MSTKLNIIAAASDVRCLDAHFDDDKTWVVKDYGLKSRIGDPLAPVQVLPRSGLYMFEAVVSAKGYAKLIADAQTVEFAELLPLSAGEAFGMRLAQWRRSSATGYKGRQLPYGLLAYTFAAYQIECARLAGNQSEVERLGEVQDLIRTISLDEMRTRRMRPRARSSP